MTTQHSNRTAISRRTMLKGFGAAIGLPVLEIMAPNSAVAGGASNKVTRMAHLYFPNGVARGSWAPAKVAADGALQKLNLWMAPLEFIKHKLIIPENLWTPRGNGHGAGTATWLTGGHYDDHEIRVGGMSVDQFVASQIGEQTLLPSLELALTPEYLTPNTS